MPPRTIGYGSLAGSSAWAAASGWGASAAASTPPEANNESAIRCGEPQNHNKLSRWFTPKPEQAAGLPAAGSGSSRAGASELRCLWLFGGVASRSFATLQEEQELIGWLRCPVSVDGKSTRGNEFSHFREVNST